MDGGEEAAWGAQAMLPEAGRLTLLRGIAVQLHADEEALLCKSEQRSRFGSGAAAASNTHTLLASNLALLPSGPPCLRARSKPSRLAGWALFVECRRRQTDGGTAATFACSTNCGGCYSIRGGALWLAQTKHCRLPAQRCRRML